VNSALTLSIVAGMGVADLSEHGFALGWDEVKLPHPVFPGDTLYSETEVLETRESRSRPTQGVVKVETRGYNQHGDLVIQYRRSVMVYKREHAPGVDIFPEPKDAPAGDS
jgi:acyl dehydratase